MNGKSSVGDWLPLLLAMAVSAAWVVFAGLYLYRLGPNLSQLTPSEAAGLFAGIGGPLAAFWLFMAVVEQRRRLARLSQTVGDIMGQHRHSLQIAETQTRALIAFQAQAERGQAAETRALVLRDLAASGAILAERLGVIRDEDVDLHWARFGSGDVAAFVQPFLHYMVTHPDIGERLVEAVAGDTVAANALHAYVRRFEKLTATLDDKLVRDVLEEGPLGRAYRLFKPAAMSPVGAIVAATVAATSPAPAESADAAE